MKKDPNESKHEQLMLIHALANKLPWIVLSISLFAFFIIFLQAYFAKN